MNSKINNSLVNLEYSILKKWEDINILKCISEKMENDEEWKFLDGPPFATGLPHYGHILVSIIKRIDTIYKMMNGYKIDLRIGWDTHGVPIEMLVNNILKISSRKEIEDFGIDQYNTICRNQVLKCASDWKNMFKRIGRFADTDNTYMTMDKNFMESVWWIFSQLYKKNFIYQAYKIMPYSTVCQTPFSNFEANQNYLEVEDPSIIVSFKLKNENKYFLAMTTTPWTLPSNMALCLNPNMYYVEAEYKDKIYIVSEKYAINKEMKIIKKMKGFDLSDIEYEEPIKTNNEKYIFTRKTLLDSYIKDTDDNPAIVHLSPAYGEDDFRICIQNKLCDSKNSKKNILDPINEEGKFIETDFKGFYFKDADKKIIEILKEKNLLFENKKIKHSYPYCWRSNTPLIYKLVSSWFIDVKKIKNVLITRNTQINWIPNFIGEKKFHNMLECLEDWCIGRTRIWGTPIPIWISDDGQEIICIESTKHLEELTGIVVKDLHREHIDNIKIPSSKNKGFLKRIDEVFDCWFESGSMPFAQNHYPFSGKDIFDKEYIADFITESTDQTRGWFYTLLVLSTALMDKIPFKNVIVTGIINGKDGKKMSKSKGNYPDPNIVLDKYGADSISLYFMSSPVVKAESINFNETNIQNITSRIITPYLNILKFCIEKLNIYTLRTGKNINTFNYNNLTNIIDKWIINETAKVIKKVNLEMNNYQLNHVYDALCVYIDQLSNWYLKLNREILKGPFSSLTSDQDQWEQSLSVLKTILLDLTILLTPFTPFIAEHGYLKLGKEKSVFLEKYPKWDNFIIDDQLILVIYENNVS